jgi:hypothetical protein
MKLCLLKPVFKTSFLGKVASRVGEGSVPKNVGFIEHISTNSPVLYQIAILDGFRVYWGQA